nr:tRNA (adenosine(37)-N6)-threonylcarbamoyltransferase complex ATPase subunit type 1 TsaE [uncultured Sellimonas sp.]
MWKVRKSKEELPLVRETFSEQDTYHLGEEIGRMAQKGDVFTLEGDLGVGKTVFTKGLAKGLGVEEDVSSPTFTIVQEYEDGRIPFYHFDVYRIGDVTEMDEIGYEDYIYGEGVCLIEWANLIEEILPPKRTEIRIEKDLDKGFDYRKITIHKLEE